jgi:hypothetical protein
MVLLMVVLASPCRRWGCIGQQQRLKSNARIMIALINIATARKTTHSEITIIESHAPQNLFHQRPVHVEGCE